MDEVYQVAQSLETGEEQAPQAGEVFQTIEAEFPEMPTLIYDGPFSESLTSPKVRFLEGKEEVTAEQAKKAAARSASRSKASAAALPEPTHWKDILFLPAKKIHPCCPLPCWPVLSTES